MNNGPAAQADPANPEGRGCKNIGELNDATGSTNTSPVTGNLPIGYSTPAQFMHMARETLEPDGYRPEQVEAVAEALSRVFNASRKTALDERNATGLSCAVRARGMKGARAMTVKLANISQGRADVMRGALCIGWVERGKGGWWAYRQHGHRLGNWPNCKREEAMRELDRAVNEGSTSHGTE